MEGGPLSPRPGTPTPNLEQQRKRAKDLRRSHERGALDAGVRVVRHLPRARTLSPALALASPLRLSEAQFIVAREAGFASWPDLKHALEDDAAAARVRDLVLDAALAGDDDLIGETLSRDPGLPRRSVHVAAAIVDPGALTAALDTNSSLANATGGRRAWTPLLYLCTARARRDDIAARLAAARLLLDRGARVSGREPGWRSTHGTMLSPRHELFAVEAAAGSAIPELVALLLEAGASLDETTVALVQAVRGGNTRVLELLLERLPSHLMWQVGWALREAVAADRVDMARMLAPHANLPAATAFCEAISAGRGLELLGVLLGERTDSRTGTARDAGYVLAVRHDHRPAAAWLLERGANPAAPSAEDFAIHACLAGSQRPVNDGALAFQDEHHRMLSWAIRYGRLQAIPALLGIGLDPNVSALDGETPLSLAAGAGAAEVVDALLAAGARVNDVNFDGETALDAAVRSAGEARAQMVARLVGGGARANDEEARPDAEAVAVLFERAADAIARGDAAALRVLLDEEPSLAQARSPRPHRATLLHYCGANGVEEDRQTAAACDPALLRLLLERGANPNATCLLYGGGATTLGLMLTGDRPVKAGTRVILAEILLRAGASIEDDRRAAPLVTAAALGDLELVKRALTEGVTRPSAASMQTAFRWACEFARTPVIACLLDQGVDLLAQNGNGQTGLHLAALAGSMEAVRLLIARGAPLEIENAWGGTVLGNVLWATVNHDPHTDYAPIVEALVAAGAVVDSGYLSWFRRQHVLRPDAKARIEAALVTRD